MTIQGRNVEWDADVLESTFGRIGQTQVIEHILRVTTTDYVAAEDIVAMQSGSPIQVDFGSETRTLFVTHVDFRVEHDMGSMYSFGNIATYNIQGRRSTVINIRASTYQAPTDPHITTQVNIDTNHRNQLLTLLGEPPVEKKEETEVDYLTHFDNLDVDSLC